MAGLGVRGFPSLVLVVAKPGVVARRQRIDSDYRDHAPMLAAAERHFA